MEVILVCLVIALVAALVVTGVMKSQLKSVRRQNTAGSYVVDDSFRLHHKQDLFLYKNVTRQKKPDSAQKGRS